MLIRDINLQSYSDRGIVHQKIHNKAKQKRKRLSFDSNLTASIGGELRDLSDKEMHKRVTHHASVRLQVMALIGAVYQVTEYSSRPQLAPTVHQGGSCSHQGYSAAHCNLTPRLVCKSRTALIDKVVRGEMNSIDRMLLKSKGLPDASIDRISREKLNRSVVERIVSSVWKDESLFQGSYLERRVMSICHQVPHEVNTEIDLRLENALRGRCVELFGDVSQGDLSTLQAIETVASDVKVQLSSYIRDAQERITQLKKFHKFRKRTLRIIKVCQEKSYLPKKMEKRLLHSIEKWRAATEACLIKKEGTPPAILDLNIDAYEALLDLKEHLKEHKSKRAQSKFIRECAFDLKKVKPNVSYIKEVDSNIHWYQYFIFCCDAQKKGSQYGPKSFVDQFGKYDEARGKRVELSQEELAKEVLWSLKNYQLVDG